MLGLTFSMFQDKCFRIINLMLCSCFHGSLAFHKGCKQGELAPVLAKGKEIFLTTPLSASMTPKMSVCSSHDF